MADAAVNVYLCVVGLAECIIYDMGNYGKLYMIPCPIGEGEPYDVLPQSNRAVIASLDYFIVENVRSARRFLSRAGIGKPIDGLRFVECNEHTRPEELPDMIRPLLDGTDAGFVSEAGVPGVADPGAEVAALCHAHGIAVVPLVGPSSILLSLMASGQNGQSFAFNGYLPVKQPERGRAIGALERRALGEGQSQIFIEAPYRNARMLEDLLASLSPRTRLTVAADVTAPGELIRTLTVEQWRRAARPDINKRPAIFIIGR